MNTWNRTFFIFFTSCFLAVVFSQADDASLEYSLDRTSWYVDAQNGDDFNGNGSKERPFRSLSALLSADNTFSDFVGAGNTVYLGKGNYATENALTIDIPKLKIKGTLDASGKPASILGEVILTANEVTLMNCSFFDSEVTLKKVEGAYIHNNMFSGITMDSLSLLGASGNIISRNIFRSATRTCVFINVHPNSKKTSNDNLFLENYFTHHPKATTKQIVWTNKSARGKKRASVRNRFMNCIFEETIPGQLIKVIEDDGTWKVVGNNGYALRFEDCYFRKASREFPFSAFTIIGKHPDLNWYWDELKNDTWVVSNEDEVVTGNKKNKFVPSIQFVDNNNDGSVLNAKYPFEPNLLGQISRSANVENTVINNSAPVSQAEDVLSQPYSFDRDDVRAATSENQATAAAADNPRGSQAARNSPSAAAARAPSNNEASVRQPAKLANVRDRTSTTKDRQFTYSQSRRNFNLELVVEESKPELETRGWYVDQKRGNDQRGNGSELYPYKSISRVLSPESSDYDSVGEGDTIHVTRGDFRLEQLEIDIPGLTIKGTLNRRGRPDTQLGNTRITASRVKLMNCEFPDSSLVLQSVEGVVISNNVFSGSTPISLSLFGASSNIIEHNEFSSAEHDSVHLFWDPESEKSSNDNVFLKNYFTHRTNNITRRAIRVYWLAGRNDSISARNRFVNCAFEEKERGQLMRVIDDGNNWWVVAEMRYSIKFEDCYFKRADRARPFSEFVILKEYPDFSWRWDELINDEWVSVNTTWALTGDHNGWNHRPRIQFEDADKDGSILKTFHDAGLKSTQSR